MSSEQSQGGESHKYLIALAVVMASLMQVIDSSIVNVAIPHMMGELGVNLDEIAWVSTGYILASVIVIPMTGWLAAFFGRKRYFATSIVIFTAASFMCGASDSLVTLVFWRIIQGLGGGALIATSQAILYEVFPAEEVGTAMALFGLGIMVGPTIGPTLGGWLTDRFSWPWIFYVNIPVGIIAAIMVITYVKDSIHQTKAKTIDFMGIALLAVTLGALQYLLEHGQRDDWFNSQFILVLGVVAAVGAGLLVWREFVIDEPVIDFRVLRHREMAVGTVIGVFFGVGLLGSVFILPVFLQSVLRMTAMQTGMVILPGAIATALSMAFAGRLANRLDERMLITVGIILFFMSMWQLSLMTGQSGAGDFFVPLILRGIGLGLIFVPLTNVTLAGLPPRELASGVALSNFFRQLGGSFGIAAMTTMLTRYTEQARSVLTEHLGVYDQLTLNRVATLKQGFEGRGFDAGTAHQLALGLIDKQVVGQASILSFGKVYLLSGAVLLATLPLLLLVRKNKHASKVSVHIE